MSPRIARPASISPAVADTASLALLGLAMAALTWGKWPDVWIDFGRELYVPWRILHGEHPHADLSYLNGPFSPYLNALWFALFGVGLRTLMIANLVITLILAALIYALFRAAAGRFAALLAGACFILLFAFSNLDAMGSYNFIAPYASEMLHGVTLSFGAMCCMERFLNSDRLRWAALAGLLIGCVWLTKPELFVAVALGVTGGGALLAWREAPARRRLWAALTVLIAGAIAAPLAVFIALCAAMPAATAWRSVLGAWPTVFTDEVRALVFYRNGMGLFDPDRSLWLIGVEGVVYAGCVAAAWLISKWWTPWDRRLRSVAGWVGLLAVLVSINLGLRKLLEAVELDAFRPLPLVMALAGGLIVAGLWLNPGDHTTARRRRILLATMSGYALLLMLKILLYARIHHYGFALAMPAVLLSVVLFIVVLPRALSLEGQRRLTFQIIAINLCAIAVVYFFGNGVVRNAAFDVPVGRGADRLVADARGALVNRAIELTDRCVAPTQTMAVLPEGVILNYLTRRENPTPYIVLMPVRFLIHGEQTIADAYAANPPDWIWMIDRDMREYGRKGFGADFGQALVRWIRDNYEPVEVIESIPYPVTGPDDRMVLLRRSAGG